MKKLAKFWIKKENNSVKCFLCNHSCLIKEDQFGKCCVRKNENGELFTMIYGSSSSMAVDPIEKKPLYHFYPGSKVLSFGTIGCNFNCLFCQNSSISRASLDFPYIQDIDSEEVVLQAKRQNCDGIAWTYNEPTIWHEFTYDSSKLAKKNDLYTVYVSNGYIQEDPLKEISTCLDAINIDVKAFNEKFYQDICKASLEPVLKTCIISKELGIHLELTYLIIPSYNDSEQELRKFCEWVVENLGLDVPIHFSRFHPDYKMRNVSVTPMEIMLNAYQIARDYKIRYPYLGNIAHGDYEDTKCPKCGNICIKRYGYSLDIDGMNDGKCKNCGYKILNFIK